MMNINHLCSVHSKPITHYCTTPSCPCQIKLCEDCCLRHQRKHPKNVPIKMETCIDKINIQLQISEKQYSFVNDFPKIDAFDGMTVFDSTSQVKTIETLLKKFTQQTRKAGDVMKKFNLAHAQTKNTFASIQKDSSIDYLKKISNESLIEASLRYYSKKGQQNIAQKWKALIKNLRDTEYFLKYVKSYGHSLEQFIAFAFDNKFIDGIDKIADSTCLTLKKKTSCAYFQPAIGNQDKNQSLKNKQQVIQKQKFVLKEKNASNSMDNIVIPVKRRINIFYKLPAA